MCIPKQMHIGKLLFGNALKVMIYLRNVDDHIRNVVIFMCLLIDLINISFQGIFTPAFKVASDKLKTIN